MLIQDSVKSELNERGYEWRMEILWLAMDPSPPLTSRGIVRGDRGRFDQGPHAKRH